MPIKIEFMHGKFYDVFTGTPDSERDYTAVTVTCGAAVFEAEVARDSRDQPNRRIARMKALEKAIAPLPRAQRIEIWNAYHHRADPKSAAV